MWLSHLISRRGLLAAAAALPVRAMAEPSAPPAPVVFYGGAAGRLTMARDRLGGNPFASAFVDVLSGPDVPLSQFGAHLAAATWRRSGGNQAAEAPRRTPDPSWRFAPDPRERRLALVLAASDYSVSGVSSLPGALFDARRVEEALIASGFATDRLLDRPKGEVIERLAIFAEESRDADVSLVWIAGHGVQHRRVVYWLMGDYPDPESASALPTHAVSVPEVSRGLAAWRLNFIFFSPCRNDPFIRS